MNESGFTLIEVMAVLTIIGLSVGVAAFYLAPLETPLRTGTVLLEGFFRQVRRQAMATTSAYRVVPVGTERLIAQRASSCLAETWVEDPMVHLRLPNDVDMTSSTWNVCFSSRGISMNNVVVTLVHPDLGQRGVEVLIGGTTRIIQ